MNNDLPNNVQNTDLAEQLRRRLADMQRPAPQPASPADEFQADEHDEGVWQSVSGFNMGTGGNSILPAGGRII